MIVCRDKRSVWFLKKKNYWYY